MSQYLASRINTLQDVKKDIFEKGHSKYCPLWLPGYELGSACAYCKEEFVLVKNGMGCPCNCNYCKDRLLEVLDKWIAIAEETLEIVFV